MTCSSDFYNDRMSNWHNRWKEEAERRNLKELKGVRKNDGIDRFVRGRMTEKS